LASSTAANVRSISALMTAAMVIRNDTCLPYYLLYYLMVTHLERCIGLLHGGQGAVNLGLDGDRLGNPE
jgi:hypothetical protein